MSLCACMLSFLLDKYVRVHLCNHTVYGCSILFLTDKVIYVFIFLSLLLSTYHFCLHFLVNVSGTCYVITCFFRFLATSFSWFSLDFLSLLMDKSPPLLLNLFSLKKKSHSAFSTSPVDSLVHEFDLDVEFWPKWEESIVSLFGRLEPLLAGQIHSFSLLKFCYSFCIWIHEDILSVVFFSVFFVLYWY